MGKKSKTRRVILGGDNDSPAAPEFINAITQQQGAVSAVLPLTHTKTSQSILRPLFIGSVFMSLMGKSIVSNLLLSS